MDMTNIHERSLTATASFKFMTDAIAAMTKAENWVNRIASEYDQKLDFTPVGVENGKIYFRVSCRKKASDIPKEMIADMEQKSNFEPVKVSDRLFLNEYAASVYV